MSGSLLPLFASSLGLQGPSALLHTLREAQTVAVRTVVQLCQLCQRQDVVTGDPQDGQLGQLLPVRVTRNLLSQSLKCSTDGVDSGPLSGVS